MVQVEGLQAALPQYTLISLLSLLWYFEVSLGYYIYIPVCH